MPEPILRATRVSKAYSDGTRTLQVLREINLALRPGEAVAVLGRSGTGKSTLLNLLGLLDRPTGGEIRIQGEPTDGLTEHARTRLRGRALGFVFQHFHLLHELTALENVALGGAVGLGGSLRGTNRARAEELLAAVGLDARATHRPGQLSGGEQQRVAIARALMCRPAVLLCDEPTGNLDPETGQQVLDVFWHVMREQNMAMILVTHEPEVGRKADRVLRLQDGILAQESLT